ncbi:hypothetical protein CROQUDRAFT_22382, partial [Cronartium quercuum f. sp. fusiforme G11]
VPLVQCILDDWLKEKNSYQMCLNQLSVLPTGVQPKVCYFLPEKFGGNQGLVLVPLDVVQGILDEIYPDRQKLFMVSSPDFEFIVNKIMAQHGWSIGQLEITNMWMVFELLIEELNNIN